KDAAGGRWVTVRSLTPPSCLVLEAPVAEHPDRARDLRLVAGAVGSGDGHLVPAAVPASGLQGAGEPDRLPETGDDRLHHSVVIRDLVFYASQAGNSVRGGAIHDDWEQVLIEPAAAALQRAGRERQADHRCGRVDRHAL